MKNKLIEWILQWSAILLVAIVMDYFFGEMAAECTIAMSTILIAIDKIKMREVQPESLSEVLD